MKIDYKPFSLQYLDELYNLSLSNNDVLKPNTKMLYFIIGKLFFNTSFVALNNDKVIGFIVAFQKNNKVWLHQLAVDKNYRKKGIASKLIDCLENEVIHSEIEFSVKADNLSAIRLYESLGYQKTVYNEQIEQLIYAKKL